MTEPEIRTLEQKLLKARSQMMLDNPFLAQLLMHAKLEIVPDLNWTAGTNGRTIKFDERFLDKLTDSELQTVLMHELMHILFRHMDRLSNKNPLVYNIAGDIVINDLILEAKGENLDAITLGFADNEVLIHELPEKIIEERDIEPGGRNYTADQIYDILTDEINKIKNEGGGSGQGSGSGGNGDNEESDKGKPKQDKDAKKRKSGQSDEIDDEADAADDEGGEDKESEQKSKNGRPGKDDAGDGEGQNGGTGKGRAAGKGGSQFTSGGADAATKDALSKLFGKDPDDIVKDDHSEWGTEEADDVDEEFLNANDQWRIWVKEALEASDMRNAKGIGFMPCLAQRLIGDFYEPKINWREILHDFIQLDMYDYTFNPPDHRYSSSGYLLPAFKVPREEVKNICFYVDGSGSIDEEELTAAYSEIKGCIEQFENVQGYIGCFDAAATDPMPFEDFEGFKKLCENIYGGGGTDVTPAFEKIAEMDDQPEFVVIITDGYLTYPRPEIARGVPVLWILTTKDGKVPTWGQVAYINKE